jgi:hypothetical protein
LLGSRFLQFFVLAFPAQMAKLDVSVSPVREFIGLGTTQVLSSMAEITSDALNVGFKKTAEAEHQYSTGMQRDNRVGKGALHWMPWQAVWLVSTIYEHGNKGRSKNANKDGEDRNWENGGKIGDFIQSALNHITAYNFGDRSEAHIPQAIWNLLNALQISIWVYLGLRPKELNTLVDHGQPYGAEPPCPLSQIEIDRLTFKGIIPKSAQGTVGVK